MATTIPAFDPTRYDWTDPANPKPIVPVPQSFAEHVANPANLQALAGSLTPAPSVPPASSPNFYSTSASIPPSPQVLPPAAQGQPFNAPAQAVSASPAASPASWFQPSAQTTADQAQLRNLQDSGAGLNGIQSKPLRVLARIGDIAGTILAPGVAAAIPGTTLHNRELQSQQQARIGGDVAADQARTAALQQGLQAQDTMSQTRQRNAEADQAPLLTAIKQSQLDQKYAAIGQRPVLDGNGTPTGQYEDDPNSLAFQKLQATKDVMSAHQELWAAQADLARSKNDPNSPAYKLATARLAVAQRNSDAAERRSQAYYGNYLQGAYNTGLDGQVLPGAPLIQGDNGQVTAVGSKNASQAVKSQGSVSGFNDVNVGLDDVARAAQALQQSGGKLNNPTLLQAYKEPVGTLGQWAQNALVKGNLSPQERDLVTSIVASREKIQGLRKSAGGSTSDSQVDRLEALLPGPNTPDFDYFNRQMGKVRSMSDQLSKGVTTAKGGLNINGGALGGGKPNQATRIYQGHTYAQGADGQWRLQTQK